MINEDYNTVVKRFQEEENTPWKDWIKIEKFFPNPGKQGIAGIAKDIKTGKKMVFKVSKYLNYLIKHEMTVMQSLTELQKYCIHFCKFVGSFFADTDPTKQKHENIFELDCKNPVEKEVLLMEYISDSHKFFSYIQSETIPDIVLYSIIKQTICAIAIAQRKKQFTHYDLHSNNIMIKKCPKDTVFLYILNENIQFCVPTHGKYPIIIDYGFSYTQDMDNQPLWPAMKYTDTGFTSDRFDPFSDCRLFLITCALEIRGARKNKNSKTLKNIAVNAYHSMNPDWGSGWDTDTKKSASEHVIDNFFKFKQCSKLFSDQSYVCIDILQTLITSPLRLCKVGADAEISFVAFFTEFAKIEREIGSMFYCLYILQGIVNSARSVMVDYKNKNTRNVAISYFRTSLIEHVDSVATYCNLADINYEKMLCALLCLSKHIESIMYNSMRKKMEKKWIAYKKVPIKTPEQMYSVLDVNIPDTYIFNEKTNIIVFDAISETQSEFALAKDEIDVVNTYDSVYRGFEIYKILKSRSK